MSLQDYDKELRNKMGQVIVKKERNGLGKLTLNRPEALNALSSDMLQTMTDILQEWRHNEDIRLILFDSVDDRAFCAGGDIKSFYLAKQAGENISDFVQFFELEYRLDAMIYNYPKPIIANLDGIVMGGGVGLTYGADYKIVTERTKWAMPEMNIGFFPDVGAAYFLNKAPGSIGRYVALTARTLEAADVIYLNAANIYMNHAQIKPLWNEISEIDWHHENINMKLQTIVQQYSTNQNESSLLKTEREKIDKHFTYPTIEEIMASLESDPSEFSQNTLATLQQISPVSLKVTLEQLKRGKGASVEECLKTDLILAGNFLRHPDFYEGVRSVLIDKDRNPNYTYKNLKDVSEPFVESFFTK